MKYKSLGDLGETSRKLLILFGPAWPFNLSIIYCTPADLDSLFISHPIRLVDTFIGGGCWETLRLSQLSWRGS